MSFSKQTNEPLFPDLLWSKPENKNQAGKLLIIGGNLHDIARISEAAGVAYKAGAGTVRILVPDALKKLIGISEDVFYGTSNPSGAFSRQSLSEWLELASWADTVLLPGELGKNSETAIVLESFIEKYTGPLTVTRDAIDLLAHKQLLLNREKTLLVASFGQLQTLLAHLGITISMDAPLQKITEDCLEAGRAISTSFITSVHDMCLITAQGKASATPIKEKSWRLLASVYASVWMMHFPDKPFEALTSSIFDYSKNQ